MKKNTLKSYYPALPVGYSWKGYVDNDDVYNVWVTVKLRRDVKVAGVTLHLPYGSALRVSARNGSSVPNMIQVMAEDLMVEKLGVVKANMS